MSTSQIEANSLGIIAPLPFVQTANSLWTRELFPEENITFSRKTSHLDTAEQSQEERLP